MAIDQAKLRPTKIPGVYLMADGKFLVRVSVWLNGTSKQLKKVLDAQTRPDDLKRAVLDLKAEARNPAPKAEPTPTLLPPTTSQRFDHFCAGWFKTRSQRLSPSTAETYEAAIEKKIEPRLGHLTCGEVTRGAIESWVVWAESLRQKDGSPYTQDTMRQWWRVLRCIVADLADDLDVKDPTTRVRPPERPELHQVREQHTLDLKQVGKLLDACKANFPQWYAEVAVEAMTGMRAGEVYGLKWDCIDFAKNQITVRRAVSRGQLRETTKTKKWRMVPMHKDLREILEQHQLAQVAHDKKMGLETTELAFPSSRGDVRDPKSAKKIWPVLCEKAEIDHRVGPQVLRRSMNTMMLAEGVDRITLRAIMGHTSEAMTERYAGIGDQAKHEAMDRVRTPPAPVTSPVPSANPSAPI